MPGIRIANQDGLVERAFHVGANKKIRLSFQSDLNPAWHRIVPQ
jgi:hypothetical protein